MKTCQSSWRRKCAEWATDTDTVADEGLCGEPDPTVVEAAFDFQSNTANA